MGRILLGEQATPATPPAGFVTLFSKIDHVLYMLDENSIETAIATLPVTDTTALVKGSADSTKLVRLEVDGLTTDTIRVLTVPDKDLTLVGTVDKLSAFAATTSAELAGVISDKLGASKLRFDTAVTTKTATATLTIAEAGTILVKSNIVIGTDIAFVDGGAGEDTITSVANAFGGYAIGDSITITGAANAGNNSTFTLTGAVAGTLTVATASLTAEAAGASVTINNAYTITLPTAVNNTGLTYHFIKTDANYKLITLDGNGTETLNYENSTGVPTLTYARLNTYCAEVTIVSDGANWQCINERLGQVPMCRVYLNVNQLDLRDSFWCTVELDTETYDVGSNYDISNWVTSTATSTTASHLIDSTAPFTAAMLGKRVKNTTDTTYTYITAYNSTSDVTLHTDIFVSGEGYEINNSKFVAPVSGYYSVKAMISFLGASVIADKRYFNGVFVNTVEIVSNSVHASNASEMRAMASDIIDINKDDYIELKAIHVTATNTIDLSGTTRGTFMTIKLERKE